MIPGTGFHYLNMERFHDDSLKESLRLKMLNQEDMFKKQVQELHRLYQMQMMLMQNLEWEGVVTKQSLNCSSQGILQKPSGRVKHIDQRFLNKGHGSGTRENPVQVEYYSPGDSESSLDEVNLSLSIGGGTKRKRSCRKVWLENLTSVSCQEIIDLEESSHTELSGDIEPMSALGCIAGSAKPGNLQGNLSNCISLNGANTDLANGIKRCESIKDESKTNLEQNSLDQGVTKWLGELPAARASPVTKEFTSHPAFCLDLNIPLLDESLSDSKDLAMESSVGACSGITESVVDDIHKGMSPDRTSWRVCDNNCSNEVALIQQDTEDIMMMTSNSTNSSSNTRGGKALSPDLDSSLRLPPDCSENEDRLTGNSQHKDPELGSTLSRRNDKDKTVVGVNDDITGDENAVLSQLGCMADGVEDGDSSPSSCKSDYMTPDHACSLKTVQSGIYLGKSDLSRANSSPNSESSENESPPSPGESKSGSSDEKKEGSAHNDSLVQDGAASLMYLLLESSRRENDRIAEVDEANEKRKDHPQPECSSDTFESMVLKLQESNTEDYCVTSTPQEVIGADNKDYGVKLRRGRRMKDFQKDILPSLASLSRHEISEDVRIMEGVIRSREYKRLCRSKMSRVENWFTPVRSRRSRLNYVGRKCYS